MVLERIRQVYIALVGLLLLAGLFPLVGALRDGPRSDISLGDQMILGIYAPFGAFLLLASRMPSRHRSLIVALGWSTIAHIAVMMIQSWHAHSLGADLPSLAAFGTMGLGLLLLAPPRRAVSDGVARPSSAGHAA